MAVSSFRRPVAYILIAFDALLIICFVLGYSGRYIHPKYVWWLQLIAISLPVTSLLLIGAASIAAMLDKWGMAGIHIVLILLAAFRFLPFQALGRLNKASEDSSLTVLSFNAKDQRDDHLASAALMHKLLEQEQPDILCFQEVAVRFIRRSQDIGGDYHILVPVMRSGDYKTRFPRMDSSAVYNRVLHPIFGNLEYIEQKIIHLPSIHEHEPRGGVTKGVFMWEGRQFAIYNIHLRSFTPENDNPAGLQRISPSFWRDRLELYQKDFLIRAREAEQVRRLLDEETLPFIVCGDFNSTPHNWVYWHIAKGLKDTFQDAGRGSGASYHSRFPIFRIDYVITSPEWRTLSAYTSKAGFSDHLPLVAKLSWLEQKD